MPEKVHCDPEKDLPIVTAASYVKKNTHQGLRVRGFPHPNLAWNLLCFIVFG